MAFDTFLKLTPERAGEATADGHTGEIEVLSFSMGASMPSTVSTGTGLTAGKASLSSFNLMKKTDKASPILFQDCCVGTHFTDAVVTLRKAANGEQKAFLTYTFKDLMVESVQWSGSTGGDDTPMESMSVAFVECKVEYLPQADADGTLGVAIPGGFNVQTGKKV